MPSSPAEPAELGALPGPTLHMARPNTPPSAAPTPQFHGGDMRRHGTIFWHGRAKVAPFGDSKGSCAV